MRAALSGLGTIVSCDLARAPPVVTFATHAEALKATEAEITDETSPRCRRVTRRVPAA